ncbi:hypothetical protein EV361DRAFT_1038121 [Lentinula raphanica]|uniref:Uncharacterized protein n=1 Tax=Lentinula raphanica TaxID=153919 RepID=A0AA38U947_9AGAR|nr:hypothetical protein F5878DRAFT_678427 [Lentinula raphanica]KAJ3963732.1 hypothetical protein EV361DRAFT_1038121 [Lentinula raphanica]
MSSKAYINRAVVHYINGDKTITRGDDGNFTCYCTSHPHGHIYTHVDSIRKHGKTVSYASPSSLLHASNLVAEDLSSTIAMPFKPLDSTNRVLSPEEINVWVTKPLEYGDQIKQLPELDSIGLVYQSSIQAVLCTVHHIVLKRTYVIRHIENDHKDRHFNHQAIKQALDTWNVPDELPALDPIRFQLVWCNASTITLLLLELSVPPITIYPMQAQTL